MYLSFRVRLKNFLKSLIELLPQGQDYLLARTLDEHGVGYRGCFGSFEEALSSRRMLVEYDALNANKKNTIETEDEPLDTWFKSADYAVVYWLNRLMREECRVTELGGSLGHFYYSSKPYLPLGNVCSWQIAELPEAVKLGRQIAEKRRESNLSFQVSERLDQTQEADIFLTAGTIQYMEMDIGDIVRALPKLPQHVILHNLPVHSEHDYWTIQNLKTCEVPYRVYREQSVLELLQSAGYQLVDQWSKAREINIPFNRDYDVTRYAGYYFRLENSND